MQLNIVKTTSADVARALLRCRQDWSQTLGDALDVPGIFTTHAPDLVSVRDANIAFAPDRLAADQVDAVDAAFATAGGRCLRWVSPTREPLLQNDGYRERLLTAMRLSHWRRQDDLPSIMILQARAATALTRALFLMMFAGDDAQALAGERHLDDPKFELFLAIDNGRAVGCMGLLTSGDAAMLCLHYTSPEYIRLGLGRALIDRAIEFAARATLQHVLVAIDEDDIAMKELYTGVGFEPAATIIEYDLA